MKLSLTRRTWLQWLGLSAALGPLTSQAGGQASLRVIDRRLAIARPDYGGAGVVVLDADVSRAWFAQIAPALDQLGAQGQISGLCLGDALFCLQTLAADRGWRVVRCEPLSDGAAQAMPAQGLLPGQAYAWAMRPNTFLEKL